MCVCESGRDRVRIYFSVTLQAIVKCTVRIGSATEAEGRGRKNPPPPNTQSTLFPPSAAPVQSRNQTYKNPPSNQQRALPYTGIVSFKKNFCSKRWGEKDGEKPPRMKGKSAPQWLLDHTLLIFLLIQH